MHQRMLLAAAVASFFMSACGASSPTTPLPLRQDSGAAGGLVTRTADQPALRTWPYRHVPGEVLVRFRSARPWGARARLAQEARADLVRTFGPKHDMALLKLRPGQSLQRALAKLQTSAEVVYAEPNYVLRAFATPDDPLFDQQWSLSPSPEVPALHFDIGATAAWDLATGNHSVVVAVLDSGIDATHPDLAANMWRNPLDCDANGVDNDGDGYVDDCHGVDVRLMSGSPVDDEGHGTHVAGIVGAVGNDGVGIAGVNWQVGLLDCKWLDANGEGSTGDALTCIDYVVAMKERGVDIVAVNASWGGGLYSQALADAVEALRAHGILLVAAAGNDGLNVEGGFPTFPCAYSSPNVICVASSGPGDHLSPFSNYGSHTVHLAAPGEDILSTFPGGTYATMSGTSMAAPHVSGVLALLHAHEPQLGPLELRNRVLAGGDAPELPLPQLVSGRRLSAWGALTCDQQVVRRFVGLSGANALEVPLGTRIDVAVLHLNCESPAGDVSVTVLGTDGLPTGETIVLHDDGVSPDAFAGDGVYSGSWTVAVAGTSWLSLGEDALSGDLLSVLADPELRPGFPVVTFHGTGQYASGSIATLVGDIDGDGTSEIVVSGLAAGPLYAFRADGRPVAGWPVLEGGSGVAYATLAELDPAIPGREVTAAYFSDGSAAYTGDGGALLPGWPLPFSGVRPPAAADLDGDGTSELVMGLVYRADGSLASPTPTRGSSSVAIADLFGDGALVVLSLEEAVDTQARLHAQRWVNGALSEEELPGFPVSFRSGCFFQAHPVVGDVDGDGQPEIMLQATGDLLIVSRDGALERAIPLLGDVAYHSSLALADLDGDGVLDILAQNGTVLSAVHGNGTPLPGWPVVLPGYRGGSGPVVGDLDGDGLPEVAVTTVMTQGQVHVLDHAGAAVRGFPKARDFGDGIVPAIADLDGDGRNELIVGGDFHGWGFLPKVWVYDLGGPPGGPVLWGQFMGNAQHTGTATAPEAPRRPFHRLSLVRSGTGQVTSKPYGIDCGATCTRSFQAGTAVILTATPATNQELVGWTGACAGRSADCTLNVDSDVEVGVAFAPIPDILTVSKSGTGSGTLTSSPAGIECGESCSFAPGQAGIVTLTATPASGSAFAGWSDACQVSGPSQCEVVVFGRVAVTARFDAMPRLTVVKEGTGTGSVESLPAGIACGAACTASFDAGTTVMLTPSPAAGATFAGWSGACTGVDLCQVRITGDVEVRARFEASAPPRSGGCSTGSASSLLVLMMAALGLRRRTIGAA